MTTTTNAPYNFKQDQRPTHDSAYVKKQLFLFIIFIQLETKVNYFTAHTIYIYTCYLEWAFPEKI